MYLRLVRQQFGHYIQKAIPNAHRAKAFSNKAESNDYDAVIVGAGMVGAALAALLKTSPITTSLKIALIDAKVPPERFPNELSPVPEMRVSTLTPASLNLLQRCNAWPSIAPPNSASVQHMQVWDYDTRSHLRWSARQVGRENMGYVAENSLIQSALINTIKHRQGMECIFPADLRSITLPSLFSNEAAKVHLNDRELTTRLIIGADGAASRVRELSGLTTNAKDYQQRGLVATVEVSIQNATAWQRFLPTGPFALLPVRNGLFNIVWSTTEGVAHAIESAHEQAAIAAFNEALHGNSATEVSSFSSDLDEFHSPPRILGIVGGKPKSFPLKRQLADVFIAPRLALVGDAYRVIHPLAGQGVNLGFADVDQLHNAIAEAIQTGQDIGDRHMLANDYEKKRRIENAVMMSALDAIRETFAVQATPLRALREAGLDILNFAKPIKNEIMLYAMGLRPTASHLNLMS